MNNQLKQLSHNRQLILKTMVLIATLPLVRTQHPIYLHQICLIKILISLIHILPLFQHSLAIINNVMIPMLLCLMDYASAKLDIIMLMDYAQQLILTLMINLTSFHKTILFHLYHQHTPQLLARNQTILYLIHPQTLTVEKVLTTV